MGNNLTPHEIERLALLTRELGDVQKMIGEVLRFGYVAKYPGDAASLRQHLEKEVGDLMFCLDYQFRNGDLDKRAVLAGGHMKQGRAARYLQHKGTPPYNTVRAERVVNSEHANFDLKETEVWREEGLNRIAFVVSVELKPKRKGKKRKKKFTLQLYPDLNEC